ncbi:hypothetical protein SDC9_63321 [bioreactor metagenome]|uniref:Pyruvate:ferredoxin oxidoreductase core domain-containing protein n=1 Tax=bioreactor metagenome TaxID=1076179 RepID=A0A644XLG0_9ZZZZ
MGSICDVTEEVVDYLNAHGEKAGLVKVRLYRPFIPQKFITAISATAAKIAVLDHTKEPGSLGEPLYQDVITALANAGLSKTVTGGRYGLGSKDTPPSSVFAVYEELRASRPSARRGGQGHPEEEPRRDGHELRLRVCGAGGHGLQHKPDPEGY